MKLDEIRLLNAIQLGELKGKDGTNGTDGRAGVDGAAGKDGGRGEVGLRGARGEVGGRGPEGKAGRDGVGADERVRVSADDRSAGFLIDKLEAGANIVLTAVKRRGGERLVIDSVGGGGMSLPGISIVGPPGPAGATGATGPAGPAGPGSTHPDLAAHDTLGLATDAEMASAIAAAIAIHAATPHGSDVPAEFGFAT